jgi:predicted phosphodiesterase
MGRPYETDHFNQTVAGMRIAVFSDVHGNPFACRAVLQAIQQAGKFDEIVAAGDLCLGGSDPGGCIDLLRASGVQAIYGNTEKYLYQPEQEPGDESHRRKWSKLQPAVRWTRKALTDNQLGWLLGLPFELRLSPNDQTEDDLLVVHANPADVELMILPPEEVQKSLWGEVRQADNDSRLTQSLQGVKAKTIAFGHFHYVSERILEDKRLVNVASCSLPGIDHDRRARYTSFTWRRGSWQIERHWVEYEAENEITDLNASDMPSKEFFTSYFGQGD